MITRIRQGLRALISPVRPVDLQLAESVLVSPALFDLFKRLRRSEQQHSLRVLRTLRGWGYDDQPLLTAALLHDVGKTRAAYHLWDRVLVVLVRAAAPWLAVRLGRAEPIGFRRPFAIAYRHPRWSAEMVRAAGADQMTIELIEKHDHHLDRAPDTEMEHLLVALQAADDAN